MIENLLLQIKSQIYFKIFYFRDSIKNYRSNKNIFKYWYIKLIYQQYNH